MKNFKEFTEHRPILGVTEYITIDGIGSVIAKVDSGNEAHNVLHGVDINDDGSGNITFRLSTVPNTSYIVNLIYQKAPVQFVAMTDKWAPIPDAFSDIYNNMSLGYFLDSCQDPRGPQYIARGVAGLLARAEGLSEMDRAIFASSYMNFNSQMLLDQLKTQQAQEAAGKR